MHWCVAWTDEADKFLTVRMVIWSQIIVTTEQANALRMRRYRQCQIGQIVYRKAKFRVAHDRRLGDRHLRLSAVYWQMSNNTCVLACAVFCVVLPQSASDHCDDHSDAWFTRSRCISTVRNGVAREKHCVCTAVQQSSRRGLWTSLDILVYIARACASGDAVWQKI